MFNSYFLVVEFGQHHKQIRTDKEGFFSVIDDLSTEFEIHKRQKVLMNDVKITEYYVYNYYGDIDIRGSVFTYDL